MFLQLYKKTICKLYNVTYCTCWEHSTVCCHTFQWVYSNQVIAPFQVSRNGMHCRTNILLPPDKLSVIHVWKRSQQALLSKCRSPVIIGGDGRADSPGHSAKYGSYGIIDMSTNKVLHIQLVQVEIHFYM